MIENVNTGEPPYFVNWQENGENNYKFFQLRFASENFKNRLI